MALNGNWKKSSRSDSGGACVEARLAGTAGVGVRDSKDKEGPQLGFGDAGWTQFLSAVKNGSIA